MPDETEQETRKKRIDRKCKRQSDNEYREQCHDPYRREVHKTRLCVFRGVANPTDNYRIEG